jgi:hypothetical protein
MLPPTIEDFSASHYLTFKQHFSQPDLLTPLLSFDQETDFFITSLAPLPPKDKLSNIEQYVRQHAFYDMKNGEVNGLKR